MHDPMHWPSFFVGLLTGITVGAAVFRVIEHWLGLDR